MKPVIVTAATTQEIASIASALQGRDRLASCRREAFAGEIAGWPVIVAVTGIGKVNTAATVASLLERFQPELLVNSGCAGAYPGSGLSVGDLAMATSEIMGDEGVLAPGGWHPMDLIGIPAVERGRERWFNSFPLCRWGMEKAAHVAETAGITLHRGPFVTVSTASGTDSRGKELTERFEGICETMEGGAAAQVALLYGVDFLEIRGISNMVENRDLSRWNIPLAVERAQQFVLRFLESFSTFHI